MVFPCTSHWKIWDLNHGKFTIFTTKSQLLGLFPKEFFIQSRGHEITPICLAGGFKQFVSFQLSIWERFPFLTHIFWRGWFNHQVVVYLGRNQTGWCKWLWRWFWAILGPRKDSAWCMVWLGVILLMDKILHHLGWLKPYKQWDNHHPWWCRILSINSISWPKKHTKIWGEAFCQEEPCQWASSSFRQGPLVESKNGRLSRNGFGCDSCSWDSFRGVSKYLTWNPSFLDIGLCIHIYCIL